MIKRARENAKRENLYPPNVAFVQACLTESLPIASNSIDCVLSNCVINLLPLDGKASLLREVCRVLKPGGRLVADDVRTHAVHDGSIIILRVYTDYRQAESSRRYPQRLGILCWLHIWRHPN
jgi:ubiquinone/menaquinone biosynthesis C-methylase UbiE